MQSVQPLSDGSCYQMTTARYFTPSGWVIQGNGIAPDIEVKLDDEVDQTTLGSMIAENNLDWKNYDSQLLAAYEAVEKRIPGGIARAALCHERCGVDRHRHERIGRQDVPVIGSATAGDDQHSHRREAGQLHDGEKVLHKRKN